MKMTSRTALSIIQVVIFIFVAGCQATVTHTPESTRMVPTPDLAPTERKNIPTATVAPTTALCTESKGQILAEKITSQFLPWPLEFKVYLPPCYTTSGEHPYPVLYMLHGQTNNNDQWPRLGLLDAADELIAGGEITPFIIVMPYEVTWSVGPEKSKFGETLLEDLFPYIEGNYNACNARECRAIGGLSRGGNWAVNLGFAHPELFTAVGSHSAPLFFGEINRITSMVTSGEQVDQLPRFYIDAGEDDENITQVLAFAALLKKYDIPYVYTQFTGYHSEDYWRTHVGDYLTWYSSQYLTTP